MIKYLLIRLLSIHHSEETLIFYVSLEWDLSKRALNYILRTFKISRAICVFWKTINDLTTLSNNVIQCAGHIFRMYPHMWLSQVVIAKLIALNSHFGFNCFHPWCPLALKQNLLFMEYCLWNQVIHFTISVWLYMTIVIHHRHRISFVDAEWLFRERWCTSVCSFCH